MSTNACEMTVSAGWSIFTSTGKPARETGTEHRCDLQFEVPGSQERHWGKPDRRSLEKAKQACGNLSWREAAKEGFRMHSG